MSTHPLKSAADLAAIRLTALQFHNCRAEPMRADRDALLSDCEAIAKIIDPLIKALGRYAQEHLSISDRQMDGCHIDVLRGAIVDDGIGYQIDQAFEQIVSDRREMAVMGYLS